MQPIYILAPISAGTSEIQVPADRSVNVGREAVNEFSFPHDLQMSSVHFAISADSGGCRIQDLGSNNGLFLNTKRVSTAIVVEGDEVQAGGRDGAWWFAQSKWTRTEHSSRPQLVADGNAIQGSASHQRTLRLSREQFI
ncbi:MAG: FHA domain-containing protein [Pirellulaceae bacterium]